MPRGLPWGRRSNKTRARHGGWITARLVCLAQGADSDTLHRNEGDSRDNSYRRPGAPSQVSFSERKGSESTDNDDTHLAYGGYKRDPGHRAGGEHEDIRERRKDRGHAHVSPVGAGGGGGGGGEGPWGVAAGRRQTQGVWGGGDPPVADDHRIPQGVARN